MELIKKAAYLKGLFEGMQLDKTKEESKLFQITIELLQNLSSEMEKLKTSCADNKELLFELDEDLGEIEKMVCGCKQQQRSSEHSCSCGPNHNQNEICDCSHNGDFASNCKEHDEYVDQLGVDESGNQQSFLDEDNDEEKYEVLCPHCHKLITLMEENINENEVVCPQCGKELELDFDEDTTNENADSF